MLTINGSSIATIDHAIDNLKQIKTAYDRAGLFARHHAALDLAFLELDKFTQLKTCEKFDTWLHNYFK